jgi:hypothetical protein
MNPSSERSSMSQPAFKNHLCLRLLGHAVASGSMQTSLRRRERPTHLWASRVAVPGAQLLPSWASMPPPSISMAGRSSVSVR